MQILQWICSGPDGANWAGCRGSGVRWAQWYNLWVPQWSRLQESVVVAVAAKVLRVLGAKAVGDLSVLAFLTVLHGPQEAAMVLRSKA